MVIHGGNPFKTYKEYISFLKNRRIDIERYRSAKSDWKRTLGKALGARFEVLLPDMPNPLNAKYAEWKIWFEKFVPYCRPGIVFVGHSLGGLFLAKYLSETDFPKRIRATFLVAPSWSKGDFLLPKTFQKFNAQGGKIFLYHSKDDPVVPFFNFLRYQKQLPDATGRTFRDGGHFNHPAFPELVEDIRGLY